jgi:glycolate oxidase subunit GlcD
MTTSSNAISELITTLNSTPNSTPESSKVKTDLETRNTWGKDWTTYFDIQAKAIVFPESTEDVVRIVRWATKHRIGLVPSGGRTGLSGAAVAKNDEVVVSFDRMNKISDFDATEMTVDVQAGVITETLQKYAEEKNLYYPVDFAARGSSQMGGNIATNAGGIKVVRYGLTRDWVAGLQVVTGTGEVLNLNNGLVKNATGYDLRHLFIGSEGTLGFITSAKIKLTKKPPELKVLILATNQLDDIMKIFAAFKQGSQITAFEMFSDLALNFVTTSTGLPKPLSTETAHYYVLIEVECPNTEVEENIISLFEHCMNEGWITDGTMAQSEQQAKNFWRLREDISESLSSRSPYKNDIAVTISKVPAFLNELDGLLKKEYPTWEVVWFGHIGDGNLHINILRPQGVTKEDFVQSCQKVDRIIFATVQKYSGSISAEHGVGLTKKPFLNFTRSQAEIEILKGIKKVFDPHLIINPGKVFDC